MWGEGTFGTQNTSFNIDGSFDGGATWAAHVASDGEGDDGPGAMTFAQNANSLIPNQPVYQLVGLRETEGNLGADVALTRTSADNSALADLVTVAVADAGAGATAPSCDASTEFGAGQTIGAAPGEMLTTDLEASGTRWVCFSATLDADAPLGVGDQLSDAILWEFAATSQDPADTAA